MATMSAPRLFATRIDIAQDKRQKLIEMLNRQLAGAMDLYSQTKQAHWNVKGINFYQIHELFDDLAESIFKYIDTIAERATTLGGYAMGTTRMAAAASNLPEYPRDAIDGTQHLEAMIERWSRYAADTRKCIETATSLDDQSTADLFIDLSRTVDKGLWFLEAHFQKPV